MIFINDTDNLGLIEMGLNMMHIWTLVHLGLYKFIKAYMVLGLDE